MTLKISFVSLSESILQNWVLEGGVKGQVEIFSLRENVKSLCKCETELVDVCVDGGTQITLTFQLRISLPPDFSQL